MTVKVKRKAVQQMRRKPQQVMNQRMLAAMVEMVEMVEMAAAMVEMAAAMVEMAAAMVEMAAEEMRVSRLLLNGNLRILIVIFPGILID
jgi:hypothetical protein